jgi:hypothetical protein
MIASGGTAGQLLSKVDGTDYNTTWSDPSDVGIPKLISGYTYTLQFASSFSSGTTPTKDTVFAMPVYIRNSFTLTRITVNVTSGTASSEVRMGIYSSNSNFQPSSLVVDAGTVSSTTSGFKTVTISTSLQPGVYWFAVVAQGAGSAPTVTNYNSITVAPYMPISLTTTPTTSFATSYRMTGITGALPSVFTIASVGFGLAVWYGG